MQKRFNALFQQAEDNYKSLRLFQSFELELLSAQSLSELFDILLNKSLQHFDLSEVSLLILDPEGLVRELISNESQASDRIFFKDTVKAIQALYPDKAELTLGPVDLIKESEVFCSSTVSRVLVPLIRNGVLIGSFNLGSKKGLRFNASKAVDFLSHMGSIIAVCFESSIGQEKLQRLSLMDVLTKVKNRRGFKLNFEREIARASRSATPLSFLFMDIDLFKKINDEHGHQTGDRALRGIAEAIGSQLRTTDILARYGGEEFAVILPNCQPDDAELLAERIRLKVADLSLYNDENLVYKATISIGLSYWTPPDQNAVDVESVGKLLLSNADTALYQAKREGRNCVRKKLS
ncbi:MAG: hypothetical protein COC19_07250 [SAR86 cluster bacterium]|uniref:diguanylate cyclase n=1 Tax=SAR86 cluster bacterium TaxID=2030880 RepID=A0A2A4MHG4_9GAMM|nr:MAG: hypothetical protein COC19_07250 [SAR86 cluster bacterium]